jgi:hypothetical protein
MCKSHSIARLIVELNPSEKMKITTMTVAAVALLVACKGKEAVRSEGLTGSAEEAASAAPPPIALQGKVAGVTMDMAQSAPTRAPAPTSPDRVTSSATAATEVASSMLIRTGAASIEVDKLDPAIIKIRQLATQLGGYIANSSISGGRDQVRSATLELKIPAARYDQAVGGLGGIGKVESVNTNVEDVGEEYVDITARVTNAKRLEERLVNLLATRTGKLEDVLAVERELARVREEIERYEGRMRFLRTRATMSTISITVHEPFPLLGQNPGDNPIFGAFKSAWRNFVSFIAGLISLSGILIPLAAFVGLGWIGYRRYRRSS